MRPLLVSQGEPAGIAPEVIARAWQETSSSPEYSFAAIGDQDLLQSRGGIPTQIITDIREASAVFADKLPVLHRPLITQCTAGSPNVKNASQVITCIKEAASLCQSGKARGMITAPIDKFVLQQAGFSHKGHTDYLQWLDKQYFGDNHPVVMMLAANDFRCVPVTVHQSLKTAIKSLDPSLILETLEVVKNTLQKQFSIPHPRLALSGLNPHAGENGLMGNEEQTIIIPAMEAFKKTHLDCTLEGPFPADTLFIPNMAKRFDALIAMYHDQALIPIKTLFFDQAVNISLGLRFIRTSPDHGTAYNLAGSSQACPKSMIAAIHTAAKMSQHHDATP